MESVDSMTAIRDLHERWMEDAGYRDAYHEEMKGPGLNCQLHLGDCLEVLPKLINDGVKADAIICDLPYGTTACKWDSIIPFEPMWDCIRGLIKPKGAIVLFCSQPFTSALVMSNPKWFKYCWVWDKNGAANFALAKRQPLRASEDIAVFCNGTTNYYPQMRKGKMRGKGGGGGKCAINGISRTYTVNDTYYPTNVIRISNANFKERGLHPTQKPVDLLAYLIRTYTMPGETVLDFTMGSGSTGVAAIQEGRNFIGIEKDEGYFKIAQERLAKATQSPAQLELV